MDIHREVFIAEAHEHLAELEVSLLELEESPDDPEPIGRAFRAIHTLKGSGAMFGFDNIAAFAHDVETVFDLIRERRMRATREIVDLALSAKDQIKQMVDGETVDDDETKRILALFREILSQTDASPDGSSLPERSRSPVKATSSEGKGKDVVYRIRFRPALNLFGNGTNPILLMDELRELGDCVVVARTDAVPPLNELDPEACYLYWDAILTTRQGMDAIKDVFIFVEDDCELSIDIIDEDPEAGDELDYKLLGEILIERGELSLEDLKRILAGQRRIGEMLVKAEVVDRAAVEAALVEQQQVRRIRKRHHEEALASTIRVAADKLDKLVDLVGELVTLQARLGQTASSIKRPELTLIAEEAERLIGELRDNTMSIRMVPIGTTFSKFKRLVRDLSKELDKEVVMTTEGGETELDKTMIEHLDDPLVHIIRNTVDHGIEAPKVREAQGKPRQGTVHLSAVHSGAHVIIEVSDDGSGLDSEAIRSRAVEKGLIAPEDQLSEKEIFKLIFVPGFSTAKEITDVSGRGVGMDVVKRGVEALRGSIDIHSQKGSGTTITVKLPLTLAIIDGFLLRIEQSYFVLPLSAVEECMELTRKDFAQGHGRNVVPLKGRLLPYIPLRQTFSINGERPDIEHIVVVGTNGQRVGFVVDEIIGGHQTVIKSLGKAYKNVEGVSGATILGDGKVALILDIPKLVQCAEQDEAM